MLVSDPVSLLYAPIARVLAYYGVFRHPLTDVEIYCFLPEGGTSESELREALMELVEDGLIGCHDGYFFLPDQGREIVTRRLEMERRGHRMWAMARRIASLMKHVPYVRGVFISGQLCRYLSARDSDIDYFIVAAPQRIWIVRTLFAMVRRTLLFNSRTYFCTNYYISTDNLEIRERNQYVANEVASLKPMYNRNLYEQFMAANEWVREYYPNFDMERVEYRRGASDTDSLRPLLERLIPSSFASRLDARLLEKTIAFWRRKFPDHDDRFYDVSLRSRRDESRAHPNDRTTEILTLYRERLKELGIDDDRYPLHS